LAVVLSPNICSRTGSEHVHDVCEGRKFAHGPHPLMLYLDTRLRIEFRRKVMTRIAAFAIGAALTCSANAVQADTITDWNQTAMGKIPTNP
jgi:hypothetical protein